MVLNTLDRLMMSCFCSASVTPAKLISLSTYRLENFFPGSSKIPLSSMLNMENTSCTDVISLTSTSSHTFVCSYFDLGIFITSTSHQTFHHIYLHISHNLAIKQPQAKDTLCHFFLFVKTGRQHKVIPVCQ